MSYTNLPDHTEIYSQTTALTTPVVIGPDTTGDTYAKTLKVAAKVWVTSPTIESGGWVSGGYISSATVKSGGSLYTGVVSNLITYSGATVSGLGGGACTIAGPDIHVQSGTIFKHGASTYYAYTDDDGYLHDILVTGAVHTRNGVKLKDPVIRSFLYLSAGVIMSGGTNKAANGGAATGAMPIIYSGATAVDFKLIGANGGSKGYGALNICASGVTLGGATTTVTNTPFWYHDGTYNHRYVDTDISIQDGVITGMKLMISSGTVPFINSKGETTNYTAYWLRDITLVSGLTASAPVISSGGTLFLKDGGSATSATINSAGFLIVSDGGKVTSAVADNGYIYVSQGGEASDVTVSNTINLSALLVRGAHVSGLTVSGLHDAPGVSSGGYDRLIAVLSKGALIENAEVQWGRLHLSQGATVSGATVTGGSLDIYDPAGDQGKDRPAALVNEATVAGGRIFFRGSNASGAHIVISTTAAEAGSNTNHIQNGAYVSGLTIRAGKMVEHYNGSLVDGDLAPLVEDVKVSGGNFSVGWGTAKNIWVSGGNMVLFGVAGHGTVVENLAISGGKVTALSNGVLVSNATLTGSKVANTVVSWGSMDMYAAGSGRDIVVSGGQLTVSGGATIDNLTVTGSGGWVTDSTTFLGGQAHISSARVNNLVVSGAKVANQAAVLYTDAVVSGGAVYGIAKDNAVYMSGNAKWNVVTVSRGNIYMNGGGSVTNLTQVGGQVIARGESCFISGADVTGSGEIYAQNGGKIYDVTVSNGGLLEVRYQKAGSTGHFAENVIVGSRGRANVMRYGILRNVTVSNGGLVRVGNNGPDYLYRGYVSGALIRSGGTMVLSSGGWVSGTIAEKGANLAIYISPEGDETYASIQSNGVDFTVTDTTVTGLTEINSGTSLLLFSGAVFDASQIGSIGQGGNIVVTSTTTATGATVAAGGLLTVSSGGHVTGATVNEGGTAVVHIGEGTYAEVGTVTVDGTTITGLAEGITSGVTIAVDNGIVFNGQTLLAGGGVQIEAGGSVGGLTATGGTLTLKGGYLSAATVGADTTVNATGGTISGGTINATLNVNGGTVYAQSKAVLANVVIASGAVLSAIQNTSSVQITNATVEAGGKLDLATGGAYVSGLLVKEGATFKTAANNVLVGTGINIAAGTWNVMPTEAVVDGVLDGQGSSFKDIGAFYFQNGFTVKNVECNIYLYVSNGAQVRDITATTKNGVALQNGGYAYNVKVDGEGSGYFFIHQFNGGSGVALGGAETDIAQGKVYQQAGVFTKPYDWYVDKGVVKQLSLGSGATYAYDVQKMHLREGIKADAPVVSSGGTLYISAGVEVANAKLFNAGGIRVYDGALLSGTTATGGNMWVSNTGIVKDTLLSGYGIMTVSEGGYASGITLDRAGNANNPQVKVEAANAVAEAVTISSGGILYVSNGGVASDVTVLSFGSASIAGGGTISGAVLNDDYFNTSGNPHTALYISNGGSANDVDVISGNIHAAGTGTVTNLRQSGAQVIMRGANTFVSGAVVTGKREGRTTDHELGRLYFQDDAVGSDITVGSGGMIYAYAFTSGAEVGYDKNQRAYDIDLIAGGSAVVSRYGKFYDIRIHSGARMTIGADGYASGIVMDEGASSFILEGGSADTGVNSVWNMYVSNGAKLNAASGAELVNLRTYAGAHVDIVRDENFATIQGSDTNIVASTLYYAGSANALGASVENGVVKNLGADGNYYRLAFGTDITVEDATVNAGWRVSAFQNAVVSGGVTNGTGDTAVTVMRDSSYVVGMTLSAATAGKSGLLNVWDNATTEDIIVKNGGVLRIQNAGVTASGTVVSAGGNLDFAVGAGKIEDTILKAGAKLTLKEGANTGERLTLDVADGNSITINDLGLVSNDTAIVLTNEAAGNTYTIATTGSTEKVVNCGDWGLYDDSIKAGETTTNAFTGMTYAFDATGKSIEVTEFTAAAQEVAGSIKNGTTINGNGKAAKWTQNTTAEAGATYHAATGDFSGEAWLEIDGTNLANTTLFGADATYTGAVNLYATNDAVVNNLAAGATSSGTVEGVKLTLDGATVGLAYAGGFGTVANAAETLIEEGTFQKDFYAGALANYAKTGHATQVGSVSLTIEGGEFSGNIYGASSVKAGAATSLVHSVGSVNITVKDGETTKGAQACLFAGGYATGSAASDSAVYTVGDIDVTIENGSWGAAAGGRGVFGGIFASKVTAVAENVTITISGDATMGNVYGGGWAQKGGNSIVGNVSITIDGGTIANVFGGGTHSVTAPGGATSAASVSINVSGGTITGDIFARGQSAGDVVTGDVCVTFTGDTNQSCGVYGYSYVGGEKSDAVLNYTAYTGTFSGAIGGFNGIVFDDDTAMTLSTAADDVTNSNWEFDFTDRADTLSATSFLTWSGADFENDTIKVSFADETQAKAGWNIATVAEAFTGATFDVEVGSTEITGLAYDTAISGTGTAYDGWGFGLESGVLKFKQLA